MTQLKSLITSLFLFIGFAFSALASPQNWEREWPHTDFAKSNIDYDEVISGGPPKDGIPSIDNPVFVDLIESEGLHDLEGVISVSINDETKAYPLRILMWHEIVNDTVGDVPVTVTYCPLCNAGLVFERTMADGTVLDFGTTGKLRNSDLIMYDRQTESWWQQFTGQGIVGDKEGTQLKLVPSRMESWAKFKDRFEDAKVLVPNDEDLRNYGRNPYVGYAKRDSPFLYRGELPTDIAPMATVLVIDDEAWSIEYLKKNRNLEHKGLKITWENGQSQAVEGMTVFHGEDIGNVIVQREGRDVAHHLTFAFAFHAFHPTGTIFQGKTQ